MGAASTSRIEQGDNIAVLTKLIAQGVLVDAVVTDGPYGLTSSRTSKGGFMGAKWDVEVPSVEFWKLVLQILKPGGHVLSFGGTRTYHRMVVNIEGAGFEIRDCLTWVYASGMPKSLDISKSIDKEADAKRQVIGTKKGVTNAAGSVTLNQLARPNGNNHPGAKVCGAYGVGAKSVPVELPITAPATPEAILWDGWGTGLKPAAELIVLARKPLSEKTVAANVLKWGTGALNIDGCRIPGPKPAVNRWAGGQNGRYNPIGAQGWIEDDGKGRWPANIMFDNAAAALLDEAAGGASRFFRVIYCPKASEKERRDSRHMTIKPLGLMRELVKLVTPPGGTVLDPFAGTGPTGEAAMLEGFASILIEREEEYIRDIKGRMETPLEDRDQDLPSDGCELPEFETKDNNMNKKDNWEGVACDGDGREFGKNGVKHASSNNAAGQHFCERCQKKGVRWFGDEWATMDNPAKALQEREEQVRIAKDAGPLVKYFRQLEDMAGALGWSNQQMALILKTAKSFDTLPHTERFHRTSDTSKNDVRSRKEAA